MRWPAVVTLCSLLGCGEPPTSARVPAPPQTSVTVPRPTATPLAADDPELAEDIAAMLEKVGKARGLKPKQAVRGERLDRKRVIELIMTKTDKELPAGVLEAQGELLRGMGLIDVDYDFSAGIYDVIQQNLAGYYDQHEDRMFLLDDLSSDALAETLAHELVHALQDQYFDLTAMLDYRPGDSDRVTAGHALAEGDAMSAMLDLTLGDARRLSVQALRRAMVTSVALSGSGGSTPRVLQASLIAPYVDGFRFVQGLRAKGGWASVDQAYARLPVSTEQLLHIDKYEANELPVTVAIPPLPDGFEQADQDVLGEQGLRMVFEQWAANSDAAQAAAGWGGDRFVVGKQAAPDGAVWFAMWVIAFDTAADADEAGKLMEIRQKARCEARANLGPFAWSLKGRRLAMTVGPFHKASDGKLSSRGDCSTARVRLSSALSAP